MNSSKNHNNSLLKIFNNVDLGKRMKEIRTEKGLKMHEVASAMNVSTQSYSRYENNKSSPTFDNLINIANGLGVPLYELVRAVPKDPVSILIGLMVESTIDGTLNWKESEEKKYKKYISDNLTESDSYYVIAFDQVDSIDVINLSVFTSNPSISKNIATSMDYATDLKTLVNVIVEYNGDKKMIYDEIIKLKKNKKGN